MRYLSVLAAITIPIGLYSCIFGRVVSSRTLSQDSVFLAALPQNPNRELIVESWDSYRRTFIQGDGRVIDYQAAYRSTSEGQAYAMLRAVLIDDPSTFAKTLNWSENNLRRQENGQKTDNLWAWKWGKKADGSWGTIDNNFASDGDIDAITALIFAHRRWNRPEYLRLAQAKLQDLWKLSTVGDRGKRYLLPGPKDAFIPNSSTIYLNPSYFAPYAFRIFSQVDPKRDWLSLVDSSYEILEKSLSLSAVNLPSDWVALNTANGEFQALPSSRKIETLYSFDAYRVWWRVTLDAVWFNSSPAKSYLQKSTQHLQQLWQQKSYLPARIDLEGKALVDYDATSQYAMFYVAMRLLQPKIAQEVLAKKILPNYKKGIWGDRAAYYTQNLVWLSLLHPNDIPRKLIQK
ncbi:glycosyl hydrolase family 8 [Rivularia sp. UHCC 0363]|uniref:glycosyl hydrolase family 8 n=1 Tax=Rivularia sp. UHCC 0363 TaxID=3110244 RepID=UPI002B201E10|nr:glycosyl hydrolase family 8 [Rivularia sp. UHCC 0363]MEA5597939.1 glycosyl hydrolase family 8 [Rivularia sp. UHCC 0363]